MRQAVTQSTVQLSHGYVRANGVQLHVVTAGPGDGPLVILLHGYPEYWYGWRYQIPELALAGFRVMAPDQRGYNISEKPQGVAAYQPQNLLADVISLIGTTGREKVSVVGHDWGGILAWWLTLTRPDLVHKAVMINSPHPSVFARELRTSRSQQQKSWYFAFFQLPGVPEFSLRANRWQALSSSLKRSSRPGTFTATDMEQYRRAWSRPRAATSMINWYRAAGRFPLPELPDKCARVPVQIIWGMKDAFSSYSMAEKSRALCDEGRLLYIEKGTHWVHHEFPGRVNQALLNFFNE